jgi:hypothetical protein
MRQRAIILCSLVIFCSFVSARDYPTLQFLNFWPSARVAGLAGCFTSIADDAYTAYYNPAGLPFLQKQMVALTYNPYLTGLFSIMHYLNISYGSSLKNNQGLGVFINYFTNGIEDYDINGNYLDENRSYAFAVAGAYGNQNKKNLSIGGTAKLIYYNGYYTTEYFYEVFPTDIPLGEGVCFAVDFGLLYKPISKLNVGFTVQNFGTRANSHYSGESQSLPFQSRLGIKYGPIAKNNTKTVFTAEITKNLVGMFCDPYNYRTFIEQLDYELKDIYKSIGAEFSVYDIVYLRFGYFEDIINDMGGLLIHCDDRDDHVSIYEYLFDSKVRGSKIYKVGWTYSIGITYKNASVDIGTDQYIYDFDTSNWKFTLSYQF